MREVVSGHGTGLEAGCGHQPIKGTRPLDGCAVTIGYFDALPTSDIGPLANPTNRQVHRVRSDRRPSPKCLLSFCKPTCHLPLQVGAAAELPLGKDTLPARIVTNTAARAGLGSKVSPYWLHHSYARHALEREPTIHPVQATLARASAATTGRHLHAMTTDSSSRFSVS